MKVNTTMKVTLIVLLINFSGCAGITFYGDEGLEKETGIPIYAPKPYILVSRTGAKDKPVEVSIVYLSNPKHVIYAKPRSGFGYSDLKLTLEKGQMTSFGQLTDNKINEIINSLSGLITARATASKTEAEATQIISGIGTQQEAVSPAEVGRRVGKIADDMLAKLRANALVELTDLEVQTVRSTAQSLKNAANDLSKPENTSYASQYYVRIKAQTNILGKFPLPSRTTSTVRDASLKIVQDWVTALGKVNDSVKPKKKALPVFELYEIIQEGDTTTLHPVNPLLIRKN